MMLLRDYYQVVALHYQRYDYISILRVPIPLTSS